MISCESFRARFHAATEDAALLAHLRTCDRCLDFAANVDPDVMFRALGGEDMIPPGGVDAFVDDVMRQVRVRDAENTVTAQPPVSWTRRLAIAATLAAAVTGTTFVASYDRSPVEMRVARATITAANPVTLTTKPIVETYESENATIMEVPSDANDQVKIVMIFDENLPADL